ncbi:AbrB/MazE/SpoVT family DNA-binding domain-containing protein [Caenispirillum bisanense]|uniref:Looped-hinge helix DNA binding domain-containing protein, AbrB family n=1 Tax=Caenispirillum bisanense TaxID=414052 RepID=A0A286GY30_9PROT|nr:AbrB/MazE/SpoVT family DNA-binding domain-containing protein [Caenispirillum bisanense]SOE00418.1 looped-hinge helix DNA binding domain-containing protein, AbrB family [Caenispirillum bisanense]
MSQHVTMAKNGRMVVPAQIRARLGMQEGGAFLVDVEDGQVVMRPYRAVLEEVWAEMRRYVPEGEDLAGELVAERRRAAADE